MYIKLSLIGLLIFLNSSVYANKQHAAYLEGTFKDAQTVKSTLQSNGFEVLGEAKVNASDSHLTILFTHPDLLQTSELKNREFASALRVLVNSEDNKLIFSNPEYFLRAFLQKDFKPSLAEMIQKSLSAGFGSLKPNSDLLDEDDLADYHFMAMMPYYEDFEIIGNGKTETLINHIQKKARDQIVFQKKVGKGKT